MGLLESEFQPVIKKIMALGPEKTEKFIQSLVLVIDRQQAALNQVRWSDDSRTIAKQSTDDLVEFFKRLKAEAQ